MRVYISGPMTGKKNLNYPAFNKAEQALLNMGYEVTNPVSVAQDYVRGGLTLKELIAEELYEVAVADAIYLLKGWQMSQGAKRELQTALQYGLEIMLEGEIDTNVKLG